MRATSVILTFFFMNTHSSLMNSTAQLISTYAKVARWGTTASSQFSNQGRSSGQTLWTHRSDVNIRGGQDLKRKEPVTYYYSMQAPSSKIDEETPEAIPSKGEVQERFNPRPYFDFTFDESSRFNRKPDSSKSSNKHLSGRPSSSSVVYGTPIDTFPSFDKPPTLAQPPNSNTKPPADAYSSPFNSYNPPNINLKDNVEAAFDFPPNINQPPSSPPSLFESPKKYLSFSPREPSALLDSAYAAPPKDIYGPTRDEKLKLLANLDESGDIKKPTGDYFHLPLASPILSEASLPTKRPSNSYLAPPPRGNEDNLYYTPPSPSDNQQQLPPGNSFLHNNFNENGDNTQHPPPSDYGPTIYQPTNPPGPAEPLFIDQPSSTNQDYHQPPPNPSMAEDDLSLPPGGVTYRKVPQFLDHPPNDHDFYSLGHHDVYHEIHPPTPSTTTAAPRAGHYSYYYLGRKLWYIPLYFSVYFIVYVTILILKSIARHKIQFSHNFDKGRNSRTLHVLNKTVVDAIENVDGKFM